MTPKAQERLVGGVGTVLVVGAIGAGLVLGLHVDMRAIVERPLALVTLRELPTPPPRPKIEQPRRRPARDAPAPPAKTAEATPVVQPPPVIPVPPPLPVIAAPKPAIGAAAQGGASDRPGPGEGAGGRGDGRGGGYGDGAGGDTPPRQTGGRLRYADMPDDLRAAGRSGSVGVIYTVGTNGRVSDCRVMRSSGMPALDATTCRLIEQRFRYRPARDETGRPVRSSLEEQHRWSIDREPDDGRK